MSDRSGSTPPFSITPAIIEILAQISEHLGRISARPGYANALRLNRLNRIRTIHGSLAIEGNTLDKAQVTALLEGKRVIAPPRDIAEARNAIAVYAQLEKWRAGSERSLLKAHSLLMTGLAKDAGRYRTGNVGVLKGKQVVHMAPPASRVPMLMHSLFKWLNSTDQHPLIASSVFHHEFEFIHPFSDGNGRMGRLWQTLILGGWNPVFRHVPVESLVHASQRGYYQAIMASTRGANSAPFIEFMLKTILAAVQEAAPPDTPQVAPHVTPQVKALLKALKGEMSRDELLNALKLSDRKSFRERYLQPALNADLIAMTRPDTPRSPAQCYRLTPLGRRQR